MIIEKIYPRRGAHRLHRPVPGRRAPLIGREYYLTQLTMAAYYSLVILGLTVLMGYTGQISLGHAAFFAMGGYTTAVLTTLDLTASTGSPS